MKTACIVFTALLFTGTPVSLYAQAHEQENTREAFCMLLDKILQAQTCGFSALAATDIDEEAAAGMTAVKDEFVFGQARRCQLTRQPDGKTVYRAVFMHRDSKGSLVSSYKNLLAMVKECLDREYIFKDKTSKIREVYECRGEPYAIDVNNPQPVVLVLISEDWINKSYELVLQVQ